MAWAFAAALLCALPVVHAAEGKKGAAPPPVEVPDKLAPAEVDALLSQLTDAQARQLLARQLHKEVEKRAAHESPSSGGFGMLLVRLRKSLEGSGESVGQRGAIVAEG